MIVGEERTVFVAHEALLTHYSDFFRAALNGKFKEAADKRITLADEDPVVFECFVHWLYHERFPDKVRDKKGELQAWKDATGLWEADLLVNIYLMADKYSIKELGNEAINELLLNFRDRDRQIPSANTVLKVFDCLPPDSTMSKFLVAAFGTFEDSGWLSNTQYLQNTAFVQGVLHRQIERDKKCQCNRRGYKFDSCKFHVHATPEEKLACRKSLKARHHGSNE